MRKRNMFILEYYYYYFVENYYSCNINIFIFKSLFIINTSKKFHILIYEFKLKKINMATNFFIYTPLFILI